MVAMINAGGSGSRLWPLSTPDYPKHLLTLSQDTEETMLQETYKRARKVTSAVYVITEAGHADHVRKQLPDIDEDHIIVEPARRGTASCLIMALDYVADRHGKDMPMAMLYADHVVRDIEAFKDSVKHAAETSVKHNKITMLGVPPTHPSTGLGYILKGKKVSKQQELPIHVVGEFKEKPDLETAEEYLHSGDYLWNTGYFVAPIGVFLGSIEKHSKDLFKAYNSLRSAKNKEKAYLDLENQVTEFVLIEPAGFAGELLVVPGTFDWVDIGNFRDLHDAAKHDNKGNARHGSVTMEDTRNSYVRNDTDLDVAIYGVNDLVIVINEDGVLVTTRDKANDIKRVTKEVNGNKKNKKSKK